MKVTIIADASHCGNTGATGYGFWIASDRGKRNGGGPNDGATIIFEKESGMAREPFEDYIVIEADPNVDEYLEDWREHMKQRAMRKQERLKQDFQRMSESINEWGMF